ncbi:hypothetical protein MJO28_015681 [Puccinia striiformis f. sp. tritici]|uniref:Uncharacterized protein n=1 Tax=Puccinia striiformis f. sp. tritici TaxID=168172 RepID=A0ACC0DQK3_9BASI|nr:hypothetical protein MJO28_015681 [Puccinia striiformis f. sp. tritici]
MVHLQVPWVKTNTDKPDLCIYPIKVTEVIYQQAKVPFGGLGYPPLQDPSLISKDGEDLEIPTDHQVFFANSGAEANVIENLNPFSHRNDFEGALKYEKIEDPSGHKHKSN